MSPSSSAPGPTCGVRKKRMLGWCLSAPAPASDFLRDRYGDTDLGNATAGAGGGACVGAGAGGEEAPFRSAASARRRSRRHVAQTPPPPLAWCGCFLHLMPIPSRLLLSSHLSSVDGGHGHTGNKPTPRDGLDEARRGEIPTAQRGRTHLPSFTLLGMA
nr:unnamed protein product [Digitaria exilis]